MKNKETTLGIIFALNFFNYVLFADASCCKTTPVGWIDHREVHNINGNFSIHTNLGQVEIHVLEYDEENKRYLVECIEYEDHFYPAPEESLEY